MHSSWYKPLPAETSIYFSTWIPDIVFLRAHQTQEVTIIDRSGSQSQLRGNAIAIAAILVQVAVPNFDTLRRCLSFFLPDPVISDPVERLSQALFWQITKIRLTNAISSHLYPLDSVKRAIEFTCSWPSESKSDSFGQLFHISPCAEPGLRASTFFDSIRLFGPIEFPQQPADGLIAIISSDQVLLLRIEVLAAHFGIAHCDFRAEMAKRATSLDVTKPNIR